MTIEGVEPKAFSAFFNWVYSRLFSLLNHPDMPTLPACWSLAQRLMVPKLQNELVNHICFLAKWHINNIYHHSVPHLKGFLRSLAQVGAGVGILNELAADALMCCSKEFLEMILPSASEEVKVLLVLGMKDKLPEERPQFPDEKSFLIEEMEQKRSGDSSKSDIKAGEE